MDKNIVFFAEAKAEKALREREAREEAQRECDENLDGIKLALGDLDVLAELSSREMSAAARGFVASGIMVRVAALRELLGVE